MTGIRHLFYCLSLLSMLTACGSSDDIGSVTPPLPDNPEPEQNQRPISLAFSVSGMAIPQTRFGADIIQQPGQTFRGLTDQHFVAFMVQREIQKDDTPYPAIVSSPESTEGENAKFFFFKGIELSIGARSMLAYAKAAGVGDKTGKDQNGSTVANYPANLAPLGITFSPERIFTGSIITTSGEKSDAEKIADYLTAIANTEGWAVDHELRQNFIGKGAIAPSQIAGSSASVNAYVGKLEGEVTAKISEGDLKTALLANIANKPDQLKNTSNFYPASIGLPDGAAALKWDDTNNKFVPQISTTLQGVNSMTVFAYPAELCYYVNSLIYTSDDAISHDGYTSATKWKEDVLPNYGTAPGVVSSTTRAVAIKDPLQYGVARLDVSIKAKTATLKDGNDVEITIEDTSFPLTGIIVGGQRQVGFDFKPLSAADQQSMVYDRYVTKDDDTPAYLRPLTTAELSATPAVQAPVHTLLLQSLDGEDETIILEFENNCKDSENKGIAFKGMDGIINPGTKFYLIGTILKPTEEADKDYTKRVFTQDYITTAKIEIGSLARAYNAVPDLYFNALSSFEVVGVDIKPWSDKAMSHSVYNW